MSMSKRKFDSYSTFENISKDSGDDDKIVRSKLGVHSNWTIADALKTNDRQKPIAKLPLDSFNHIAREVLSLGNSKRFYIDVLGFTQVPRPPFDCEGLWLYGYGLSLHLVETSVGEDRIHVKKARIKHFTTSLPRVDHIAFITSDIDFIRTILDDVSYAIANIIYTYFHILTLFLYHDI